MSLIVDSIFTEWRASLPEGSVCPNTKNGYHLYLLKEICLKRGISENIINSVLLMLEKKETYKLRKKDSGEISVFTNKDNYEKALDSGDYEEPEGGEEEPQTKKPEINPLFQKDGEPDDALIKTGSSKETKDDEKEKKPKTKKELQQKDHEITDDTLVYTNSQSEKDQDTGGREGVGLGTDVSRAGEAAVHKGIRMLMDGGSIDEVYSLLRGVAEEEDTFLTNEWVDAAVSSIKSIQKEIGIENIESVAWDTDEGRESIGVDKNLKLRLTCLLEKKVVRILVYL